MKRQILLGVLVVCSALSAHGQSAITSEPVAAIDNIPPAPVTDLEALVATDDNIRTVALTWTLSVDDRRFFSAFGNQVVPVGDVRGYRVYRRQGDEGEELIASLGVGVSEFVDRAVLDGVSYIYDVRPFDSDNETHIDVIPGSDSDLARIVLVDGAPDVEVETRIEGELVLDSNLDLENQGEVDIFVDEFIRQLAEALDIDPSRIIIIDLKPGSVVVSFQIVDAVVSAEDEPTPTEALVALKQLVQEDQDIFPTLAPVLTFVDLSSTVLVPVSVIPVDAGGNEIVGWFTREGDSVDFDDFFLFADHFGKGQGDDGFDAIFDIVPDGMIDFDDFFRFADDFGKVVANAALIQG